MAVIEMRDIQRIYYMGDITVRAIRTLDLTVEEGEFLAVMGPSGSGKSTLMNILGCLDQPTKGSYVLNGTNIAGLTQNDFAGIRNERIGFVFQGFNLLSRTTAIENVELPMYYGNRHERKDHRSRAIAALSEVGLEDRMNHVPAQLSGGQQQRVAIARAMVNDPAFILADEPTGNLDTEMTLEIMTLFQKLNRNGKTIIMVTHEPEVAAYTKRIVTMRDGMVIEDKPVETYRDARDDLAEWKKSNAHLSKDAEVHA